MTFPDAIVTLASVSVGGFIGWGSAWLSGRQQQHRDLLASRQAIRDRQVERLRAVFVPAMDAVIRMRDALWRGTDADRLQVFDIANDAYHTLSGRLLLEREGSVVVNALRRCRQHAMVFVSAAQIHATLLEQDPSRAAAESEKYHEAEGQLNAALADLEEAMLSRLAMLERPVADDTEPPATIRVDHGIEDVSLRETACPEVPPSVPYED